MIFDYNDWKKKKMVGEVLVTHCGAVRSQSIDDILAVVEEKINKEIEIESVKKKVFHVFVECIQNLFHHVESTDVARKQFGDDLFCAIFLCRDGSFYRISTGNLIDSKNVSTVEEKIDKINSLTEAEVKLLYRDTLYNKGFSEKGGGGLGMIDIVRKTGNQILYKMYDMPGVSDQKFFSFDVYVC